MHIYELASGQSLNLEKTSLIFSINTRSTGRAQIQQASIITIYDNFEKYLAFYDRKVQVYLFQVFEGYIVAQSE